MTGLVGCTIDLEMADDGADKETGWGTLYIHRPYIVDMLIRQ
jgi:hypothetical protein